MSYAADRAADVGAAASPATGGGLSKINSITGLSTDYLNHFTEAIMVLEMITMMPECLPDLQAWQPKTYREHFEGSRLTDRDAVIAAYEAADPEVRDALDANAETLNAVLGQARNLVIRNLADPAAANALAQRAVAWLKPLIARTGAVINGTATHTAADREDAQAAIDELFAP